MKKLTFTTAIFVTMTATSAFAHHVAEGMVDSETYEMIDENLADSPHSEMTLDDLGSAMQTAASDQNDPVMQMDGEIVSYDEAMQSGSDSIDTMVMMEDMTGTMVQ